MKKIILTLCLLIPIFTFAQNNPNLEWVHGIGISGQDMPRRIHLDGLGHIYITGWFNGTVDFDLGPGVATLTASGNDIFLAKYNLDGSYVWAIKAGGTGDDKGFWVKTDALGAVYIGGDFSNTADFDPSAASATLTSNGGLDGFVAKYDTNGVYQWAHSFGDSNLDEINGLTIDNNNNVYIAGGFSGTIDADPGVGFVPISSIGSVDLYIIKLSPAGNYIWSKHIGGPGNNYNTGLKFDGVGSVYLSGNFSATMNFNLPGTFNLTSNGNFDMFIAKYSITNGNLQWAIRAGSTGDETAYALDFHNNHVYAIGFFENTVDFDPSASMSKLISAGNRDIYVAQYDTNGLYQWAFRVGGTGADLGLELDVNTIGEVYVTGGFQGTVDFDPGVGIANRSSNGGDDIFHAKYDALGNYIWAFNTGSSNQDYGYNILEDGCDFYVAGYYSGTTDFDPNTAVVNRTHAGNRDIFLAKYTNIRASALSTAATCAGSVGTVNTTVTGPSAPFSYNWSNGQNTQNISGLNAGTYIVTVTDAIGCSDTAQAVVNSTGGTFGTVPLPTNATCTAANGSADVLPIGGGSPFSYQWSTGATSTTITGLSAGSYFVTLTDNTGCVAFDTVIVGTTTIALNSTISSTDATCGTATGTATNTPNNGTAPFSFLWSNSATTANITGLLPGSYFVTTTDANGCQGIDTAIINNNTGTLSGVLSVTQALCANGSGAITILPSGGTAPYSFLWSNSATTATITGLSAGSYDVTISDNTACNISLNAIIIMPSPLQNAITTDSVSCINGLDGTATATVSGGTAGYTYQWSNNGVGPTIINLAADSYFVTITDFNGCQLLDTAIVGQPASGLSVSVGNTTAACFGQANGTATATATGGTPAYNYAWSNGQFAQTASFLAAGTYFVTVTDANGCSASTSANIISPPALILSVQHYSNYNGADISCPGA